MITTAISVISPLPKSVPVKAATESIIMFPTGDARTIILWLSTMSPSLIYQQMKQAYDQGIQKMWILNVGDIKPAEYQIELFMDMAWNLDKVSSEGVTATSETLAGTGIWEPPVQRPSSPLCRNIIAWHISANPNLWEIHGRKKRIRSIG